MLWISRTAYKSSGAPPDCVALAVLGVLDERHRYWAVENNLISITPLALDLTAHHFTEELKRWHIEDLWENLG